VWWRLDDPAAGQACRLRIMREGEVTPAYLNETDVARFLGRSRDWLRANRPHLEREGFPRVDTLIGLTCVADIEAWIARRRQVADAVAAGSPHHHTPHDMGINFDAL